MNNNNQQHFINCSLFSLFGKEILNWKCSNQSLIVMERQKYVESMHYLTLKKGFKSNQP